MNKLPCTLIFAIIAFFIVTIRVNATVESKFSRQQSQTIVQIVKNEKNAFHRDKIIEIINRIDNTYGRLHENLQEGKKLVIFFDPAHGLLHNGKWQGGDATRRTSCTNLPEEYYSIKISRMLYKLLRNNSFIEVKTTDDFMEVLNERSDAYYDITFTKTVELADKAQAFIILSEHLNNISVLYKADGKVNLPGIHITRNGHGWKVLQYVKDTYSGFLTLYNKLDASGFSMSYALKLKNLLVERGLKPNSWNFGAVGDTRFCYFVDFPVSIIYESGFISNPEEEKNLKDPEYIKKIVEAQYQAFLETIRDTFGVDISGRTALKIGETSDDRTELLKLARLAVYFIKVGNTSAGIQVIREMEKNYSGMKYHDSTSFFSEIKNSLMNSGRFYNIAQNYKRQKKNKLARKYLLMARRALYRAPIFAALHERYRKEIRTVAPPPSNSGPTFEIITPKKSNYSTVATRAPRNQSIIFPVEHNQSLEKAIELALGPNQETLTKLVKSFANAASVTKRKVVENSTKHSGKVIAWKTITERVRFNPGIYIVRLDKNLNVASAKYVNSAVLNPWQYQNHQYLKNSYFAHDTREREL